MRIHGISSRGVGKREIRVQDLVAHVNQNGIHADVAERLSLPPMFHIDRKVANCHQNIARPASYKHKARRPQILVDGNPPIVFAAFAEQSGEHAEKEAELEYEDSAVRGLPKQAQLLNMDPALVDSRQEDGRNTGQGDP